MQIKNTMNVREISKGLNNDVHFVSAGAMRMVVSAVMALVCSVFV